MFVFCAVKVFVVLLEIKIKFLKLTKRPWVRNECIPNEKRCILLKTNKAFRNNLKSTFMIKISELYCLLQSARLMFQVFVSLGDLSFLGRHHSGSSRDDSRVTWSVTVATVMYRYFCFTIVGVQDMDEIVTAVTALVKFPPYWLYQVLLTTLLCLKQY